MKLRTTLKREDDARRSPDDFKRKEDGKTKRASEKEEVK